MEDILLKLELNGIISFTNHWQWRYNRKAHDTIFVLTKNFLIKGQRAVGFGVKPGLYIYKIKNFSNLPEAVKILVFNNNEAEKDGMLIKEEATKRHIEFFNNGINDLLNLELLSHIPQKEQTAGNCGMMAAKMAAKG